MGYRNFKGIVFDVDGVLFDTEPLHMKAWIETAAAYGLTLGREDLLPWTGRPCRDLARFLAEESGGKLDSGELYRKKEEVFRKAVLKEDIFDDRMGGLLGELSGRFAVAWATSSPRENIEVMFEKAGITGFFSFGVCLEDVSEPKPAPESYLKACGGLGLSPKECIALDDSPSGVSSALSAGLFTIGIAGEHGGGAPAGADLVFPSAADASLWILEHDKLRV